jgi:hypothetical protein
MHQAILALLCLAAVNASAADREIPLTGEFLLVPITNEAKIRPGKVVVRVGDEVVHSTSTRATRAPEN